MGMETILKSMMNLSGADASAMDAFRSVSVPKAAADPSAVTEFSKIMERGVSRESNIDGVTAPHPPDAVVRQTMNEVVSTSPTTLGDRLASARIDQTDGNRKQCLNTITDIFEKEAISHSDLYRVQVLAGMAQIEVTRNSSVNKSMDDGLKTLLKNS